MIQLRNGFSRDDQVPAKALAEPLLEKLVEQIHSLHQPARAERRFDLAGVDFKLAVVSDHVQHRIDESAQRHREQTVPPVVYKVTDGHVAVDDLKSVRLKEPVP